MKLLHTYPVAGGLTVEVWRLWQPERLRVMVTDRHHSSDPVQERTFTDYGKAVAYARRIAGVVITEEHREGNPFAPVDTQDTTGDLGL